MIGRLRSTGLAALAVAGLVGVALLLEGPPAPSPVAPAVMRFDQAELVAFTIRHRPDGAELSFRRIDGEWTSPSHGFRPSRSMMRRAAWQLHDLDARAEVLATPTPDDLARFGLGPEALTVDLELAGGERRSFAVGTLNPTGVSAYLRLLPDGGVVLVKKAATDFWSAPVTDFREERVAAFVPDEVTALRATLPGRVVAVFRTGERTWRMTEPIAQDAGNDAVQRLVGRLTGMRAVAFAADHPADLARYGIPGDVRFEVALGDAPPFVLELGAPAPGEPDGPSARFAYLPADDAVYVVRDGLLEDFGADPAGWRELRLLPDRVLSGLERVTLAPVDADPVAFEKTADAWRWASDHSPVSGSTPARLALGLVSLRAEAWTDAPPPPDTLVVTLGWSDGTESVLHVSATTARVGDGPSAEIGGALDDLVAPALREAASKRERDAGKRPPEGPG